MSDGAHRIATELMWWIEDHGYWRTKDMTPIVAVHLFDPENNPVHWMLVWDKLVELERFPTLHTGPTEDSDKPISGCSLVNPVVEEVYGDTPGEAVCNVVIADLDREKES